MDDPTYAQMVAENALNQSDILFVDNIATTTTREQIKAVIEAAVLQAEADLY